MKKGLFALALGTFTLGMTEFIIEGCLIREKVVTFRMVKLNLLLCTSLKKVVT